MHPLSRFSVFFFRTDCRQRSVIGVNKRIRRFFDELDEFDLTRERANAN